MRLFKIFTVTFLLTLCLQVALDLPVVKQYIRKEIRTAKILCLKAKYNIKPRGLSLCTMLTNIY